ncbi:MAG: ATP-binding protein [Gemmatimonadaceae bacterium]
MEPGRGETSLSAPDFDHTRFLRDLTSLLALPAFWGGTDPAFVLRTLIEALEALLPLQACYGVAAIRADERCEVLRVFGKVATVGEPDWAPIVALAHEAEAGEVTREVDVQGARLRCVRLPIGYVGEAGCLVVASTSPGFPQPHELATLHTSLTLAATGLETARLIRERDEAQRAKDEFLAMLGHELRNPLAPIITSLRLMTLKAAGVTSPEQAIIERQVNNLKSLVDDLLDISRITKGKIELHMEAVDVADVVARAAETVSPLLEQRRHDVELRVARGMLIVADPQRMTQVVSNLLNNAAKYTPPGGRIEVRAESAAGWVTIRVVDSGIGLARELAPYVFDVFVQGRQGIARSEGGLGIGLAVVKRLVQAHGGTVAAHSEGPDCGSEFSVKLPALADRTTQEMPAVVMVPEVVRAAPSSGRILVVDDNHDAADMTAAVLSAAGHQVSVAYCGLDALQQVELGLFDVLVLDIGLPDMDGYAVAAELHERGLKDSCHIVALTGYGQAHDQARSAQAGFTAHLVKPVDPQRLTDLMRQLVLDPATLRGERRQAS